MRVDRLFQVLVVAGMALTTGGCGGETETPGPDGGGGADGGGVADAGSFDAGSACEAPCPQQCWNEPCACAGGSCCWLVEHPCCI